MENRGGILNAVDCHVGEWWREARGWGEKQVVRSLLLQRLQWGPAAHERGASLVEYALLLALIALVCVGALQLLGNDVSAPLSSVGSSLKTGS
jgi:pilus assembly protein Flp/PilA